MSYVLITPPAVEPVSLAEIKAQLSAQYDTLSDAIIMSRITTARQWAEEFCAKSFVTQTWELRLDEWPDDGVINLRRGPVQSIVSVKYTDSAGVLQTMSSADYKLAGDRLIPVYGKPWPGARIEADSIQVRFVAGFGAAAANVPGPIKEAIAITTRHWMENQAAVDSGVRVTRIPYAVEHLLSAYREVNL